MRPISVALIILSVFWVNFPALGSPEMELVKDSISESGGSIYEKRVDKAVHAYNEMIKSTSPEHRREQFRNIKLLVESARAARTNGWEAAWVGSVAAKFASEKNLAASLYAEAKKDAPTDIFPKMADIMGDSVERKSFAPGVLELGSKPRNPLCSGSWTGTYFYSGEKAPPVEFTARIECEGNSCTGETRELNTFGKNLKVKYLRAKLSGKCTEKTVEFEKSCDGTGDESHTVSYTGKIEGGGESIAGSWTIESTGGPFSMKRIKP